MNKVILIGRLVRNPEVKYTTGEKKTAIASFSLAVDRKFKQDNQPNADFINCKAFGKTGEVVEKYVHKGSKIGVTGRIQTGNYTNKDGVKVYTTDIMVEEIEFLDSKSASANNETGSLPTGNEDFMKINDSIDEELPFR